MAIDLPFHLVALAVTAGATRQVLRSNWSPLACLALVLLLEVIAAFLLAYGLFHFMRLFACIVFLYLPVQLVGLAYYRRKTRLPAICLPAALVLVLIAGNAFLLEPHALETNVHTYSARKLSSPTRIVILADVQTDRITEYERHVFDEVLALDPDLVLFPGDFLQVYDHTRATEAAKLRALLQRLSPPLGMWAVQGNVDPPGSGALFAGTNVRYLEATQTVQVSNEISLTGLSLSDSFDPGYSLPSAASSFHIAMGHAPDFALGNVSGADLLVAGHTHGGQVQLPFFGPLITMSRVPRSWGAGGLFSLPSTGHLLISRGIGMERGLAPRLRFLCRPEIVVLDLKPV